MTSMKKLIAASLFVLSTGTFAPQAAHALDDAQKQEIGDFIKEYLIANPEILVEAQKALAAKQVAEQQQAAEAAITKNGKAIFSSEHDITLGNPDGDVTVVEFFDYNCGYCKRALSDMDAILESDKNVRFVLKELPILGPDSLAAHKVSAAFKVLAPEKYGDFHRSLLSSEGRANEETAMALAVKMGVSDADIRAKIEAGVHEAGVREAYSLANDLGISGTPSYVVGSEAVFGAVGVDDLSAKIASVRSCGKATC